MAINPKILHGKPVIKGTRVPVDVILGSLVGGMTYDEIEKLSTIFTVSFFNFLSKII